MQQASVIKKNLYTAQKFKDTEGPRLWREDRVLKTTSPGTSVQLGYWRQNEGVSGTDPSSSHVHPAEMIY